MTIRNCKMLFLLWGGNFYGDDIYRRYGATVASWKVVAERNIVLEVHWIGQYVLKTTGMKRKYKMAHRRHGTEAESGKPLHIMIHAAWYVRTLGVIELKMFILHTFDLRLCIASSCKEKPWRFTCFWMRLASVSIISLLEQSHSATTDKIILSGSRVKQLREKI